MKNKKRLFTSLLAAVLAVSSFSAFNASALYYTGDNEALSKEMADKGYTYIPEAIDNFAYIIGGNADKEKIGNGLWFVKEYTQPDCNAMWFGYKQIIDDYAIFYFDVSSEDYSAVVEELKTKVGYSNKIDIQARNENCYDEEIKGGVRKDVGIEIRFSENGADLNYMITEKAASILKEKYGITQSIVSIDRVWMNNMRIIMQNCPVKTADEEDVFTDEQLEEFNNTLAKNGFDVRSYKVDDETVKKYNDKYGVNRKQLFCLDIPEDMTVQEKLRYVAFVQEYYSEQPSLYALATTKQPSETFDILEVESIYKQSDANEDGEIDIADATAIIQAIGNPAKYALSTQGEFNADIDGNGLTGADAIAIQKKLIEAGMPE